MDNTLLIVVAVAALILVALALWFLQKRRSDQLRSRFGPEYERAVEQAGSPRKAEAQLAEREKRVEALSIRPLSAEERDRFLASWRQVQAEFVDDPEGSIGRADALVGEAMSARGYPVSRFEQAAEDLSVDHPRVVQHYRAAHDVAVRHQRGEADTEDLRQAMIDYRALFEELVREEADRPPQEREEAMR